MRSGWRIILTLTVLFFACGFACAQDYPMMHYTMEEGLPSNTVYSVYRDSKGFLWFATDKGVARYNGIKFELFTTFDGLPDNEVFLFQEDYEGRLWFGTYNGDLGFYQDGVFHNKTTDTFLNLKTRVSHIFGMYLNTDGSVNIRFVHSSFFLNIKHDKCTIYDTQPIVGKENLHTFFLGIKIAPDQFKLIGIGRNLIFDTAYRIISESKNQLAAPLTSFRSQNLHYLVDSSFVYADNLSRLRRLPPGFYERNTIHSYYTDGINYFYSTAAGLYINDTIRILQDCNVTSMTQDVSGNYWLSTLNNGVYCLKKEFLNTRVYKNVYDGTVKYCYEDRASRFFVLQNNSLYSFKNGSARLLFDYPKFWKKEYKYPGDAGYSILKTGGVYDYFSIYNDNYLHLHDIEGSNKTIVSYNGLFKYILMPKTLIAAKKELFIKSIVDVVVEDNPLRNDENIRRRYYSPDSTDRSRIFGITLDENEHLLFSTIRSVYMIKDGKCSVQKQFGNLAFKTMAVFGSYLLGITHNNNFVICNNFSDRIAIDSVKPQNCVWFRFFRLDSCHILISTNNLYRILTLYPSDNVPKYSISTIENPFIPLDAEGISSDGINCHFYKNHSITSIDIAKLLIRPEPPELHFTFLKTVSNNQYRITREVELSYEASRHIFVSFATRSFSGRAVVYEYSIVKGKDETAKWRELKLEGFSIENARFGNYIVKVRARTISSQWSEPISFRLHIQRPYWATWWFILACVLLAGGLTYFAIRLRIRYVLGANRKKHEAEMKFVKSEYKALNALMNPHFIFNTLNNVQSLFNANDKLAANEYLHIFSDLIRQNMYNVSKELIPLNRELNLVRNYLLLEKLRFEEKLDFKVNTDEHIDLSEFMIPPLLIQPLVENSIKHGLLPKKGGTVIVNVFEKEGNLVVEVKDNGIGLKKKDENAAVFHESFGIDNIRKRIEQLSLMQGKKISFGITDINDSDGNHLWTIATITMPL